jgi:hypothetical protein
MAPPFYIGFRVAVRENRRALRAAGRNLFGFSLDPHPAARSQEPHYSLTEYAPGPFPPRSPPRPRRTLRRVLKRYVGLFFASQPGTVRAANEPTLA